MALMVKHRVKVQPVKLRTYDAEMRCDRLHIIGYRAGCTCGRRSRIERHPYDAGKWKREHLANVG